MSRTFTNVGSQATITTLADGANHITAAYDVSGVDHGMATIDVACSSASGSGNVSVSVIKSRDGINFESESNALPIMSFNDPDGKRDVESVDIFGVKAIKVIVYNNSGDTFSGTVDVTLVSV